MNLCAPEFHIQVWTISFLLDSADLSLLRSISAMNTMEVCYNGQLQLSGIFLCTSGCFAYQDPSYGKWAQFHMFLSYDAVVQTNLRWSDVGVFMLLAHVLWKIHCKPNWIGSKFRACLSADHRVEFNVEYEWNEQQPLQACWLIKNNCKALKDWKWYFLEMLPLWTKCRENPGQKAH